MRKNTEKSKKKIAKGMHSVGGHNLGFYEDGVDYSKYNGLYDKNLLKHGEGQEGMAQKKSEKVVLVGKVVLV